jgi:hypothetical protein
MRAIASVIIGSLPILLEGFLLLRIFEGKQSLLQSWERIGPGFLVGIVAFAYATFLAGWMGMPIALREMIILHSVLVAFLLWLFWNKTDHNLGEWIPPCRIEWKRLTHALLIALLTFSLLRFLLLSYTSLLLPTYQDDAFNNWNLRARVFFETKSLNLPLPREHPFFFGSNRTSNYTPTFSLIKTWFSLVNGNWHEGVVNSLSPLLFIALLITLFTFLKRHISTFWSLLGVEILASQPLVTIHGTQPYADLAVGGYLLLCVALLSMAEVGEEKRRAAWIFLLGLSFAAFAFTKNEALILYIPPLLLAAGVSICRKRHPLALKTLLPMGASLLFPLFAVLLPWFLFKQGYGLGYGHGGSAITGTSFSMPSGEKVNDILFALKYVFFLEANWHFFFLLLPVVLLLSVRKLRHSPLLLPLLAILLSFAATLFLYFTTELGNQVINQMGVNRGTMHLVPSLVFITTILLKDVVERWKLFGSI